MGINQRWDESDLEVAFIQCLGAFAGSQEIKDIDSHFEDDGGARV